MVDITHTTPRCLMTEQIIIGTIILYPMSMEIISRDVKPEHFSEPIHEIAYERFLADHLEHGECTVERIIPHIKGFELSGSLSAEKYIRGLISKVPSADPKTRIAYLIELYQLRSVRQVCDDANLAALAEDRQHSAEAVMTYIQSQIESISSEGLGIQEQKNTSEIVDTTLDHIAAAMRGDTSALGIPTGLKDLDEAMGGLCPANLIILAGRPGMGKSALSLNIAFNMAREGRSVQYLSLEMSSAELMLREISRATGIDGRKLQRGKINDSEFALVHKAAKEIKNLPIYFDDTGGRDQNINSLESRAHRMRREKGIEALFIDYLQLISPAGAPKGIYEDVTHNVGALKSLAKKLEIPVVALSQLSREVENRDDNRPQLSDLRSSGAIEQDADRVLLMFREEYYVKKNEPSSEDLEARLSFEQEMARVQGMAEIIVAKHRSGTTGVIPVSFHDSLCSFSDREISA